MPYLSIVTNVRLEEKQKTELAQEASRVVAEALGKPIQYVAVSVTTETLVMGGTTEPTAMLYLLSIGGINPQNNKSLSSAISKLLGRHLKVSPQRYYIEFCDAKGSNVGFDGSTF